MTSTSKRKYKRNTFFSYKVRMEALYFNYLMNCQLEFKYITPNFEYTILLHMYRLNKTAQTPLKLYLKHIVIYISILLNSKIK